MVALHAVGERTGHQMKKDRPDLLDVFFVAKQGQTDDRLRCFVGVVLRRHITPVRELEQKGRGHAQTKGNAVRALRPGKLIIHAGSGAEAHAFVLQSVMQGMFAPYRVQQRDAKRRQVKGTGRTDRSTKQQYAFLVCDKHMKRRRSQRQGL